MRCTCCGQMLEADTTVCPRCGAEQTPAARARRVLISVLVLILATAFVAILARVVLSWHDAQYIPGISRWLSRISF